MKLLSQFTTYTLATVLIGIFAATMKTDAERAEIVRRIASVTRPLAQIVDSSNFRQYH